MAEIQEWERKDTATASEMPSDPTTPAALAAPVAAAFADLPEVVAVALAGSGVTGAADERSDIDPAC